MSPKRTSPIKTAVQRALERRSLVRRNRALADERRGQEHELSTVVMRLSSLIEAGRAMGDISSLPQLLDFFLGLVERELNVERASLMSLDDDSGMLSIAAARGMDGLDTEAVRVRVGEGIAGQVAQSGEAWLVTDTASDPRLGHRKSTLSDSFIVAPIMLSIPIKSSEKVMGVINVTNRRNGKPFVEEDLQYLRGLCGQLAVAIESTRRFEELQQAYDKLRETQNQLVFAERVKAVGQMASGVAHDFNNVLSVILTKAEHCRRRLETPNASAQLAADLDVIKNISMQGAETIKRILTFTRKRGEAEEQPVELNDLVRSAVEMTRPKWKDECEQRAVQVEVRFELGQVGTVLGNPYELTQVVGNLIFNAVEAMPDGGELSFTTFMDGDWVVLEVADTGLGMSEETRQRLFEPFFTTKKTGQGLGTSIVYGIIGRHGGEIAVDSGCNRGSRFRVRLPARPGLAVEPQPSAPASTEERSARVLLVDDDAAVLETFQEALEFCGHRVEAKSSGADALQALEQGDYDVVITDLSMPGISGLEVAAQAKQTHPDLPVILLSGFAVEQSEARIRDARIDRVLCKPCSMDRLLQAIDDALPQASQATTFAE